MTFLFNILPLRIHAVIIIFLSMLIPSINFSTDVSWYLILIVFVTISICASALTINISFRNVVKQSSAKITDLLVFLSLWTGFFALSMDTIYPEVSVRNYPDLHKLFPTFFLLGVLLLVYLINRKDIPIYFTGWIMVFIITSLPFTRPLDQNTFGLAFPFMGLLYTLHRSSELIQHLKKKHIFTMLVSTIMFLIVIHGYYCLTCDFDRIIPELLFCMVALFNFILAWIMASNDGLKTIRIFKNTTIGHLICLSILALGWFIWMSSSLGVLSIIKYRLWISLIHPSALGAFLAMTVLLFEPWSLWRKRSLKYSVPLFLALILLILTQSRSGIFSCIIIICLFLFFEIRSGSRKTNGWLVNSAASISSCLIILLAWRARYRLFDTGMIHDRLALWKPALRAIGLHFSGSAAFTGFGLDSKHQLAEMITPSSSNVEFLRLWMSWDHLGHHFHNIYLETMWIWGFTGLALMISICWLVFKNSSHSKKLTGLKAAFAFVLLSGFVDCPFYYPAIIIFVSSIAGIIFGHNQENLIRSDRPDSVVVKKIILRWSFVLFASLLYYSLVANPLITRYLYNSAKAWSGNPHFSNKLFQKAGKRFPPSFHAAEQSVNLFIATGKYEQAAEFLEGYPKDTKLKSRKLIHLRAWLQNNSENRSKSLEYLY
ncbi:hypothetical protein K8T06_06870, partial [bacterium]|nr:hypothetical protein [bacterium]